MLYLCDNHALLKAVKRRVGKVGYQTQMFLREAIEELRKETTAGAAMFLIK